MNRRDIIDIEIRKFRLSTLKHPSYIIINFEDYLILKEEIGKDYGEDIIIFAGCNLLITMDLKKAIFIE